jgi:hypothetical protein
MLLEIVFEGGQAAFTQPRPVEREVDAVSSNVSVDVDSA